MNIEDIDGITGVYVINGRLIILTKDAIYESVDKV